MKNFDGKILFLDKNDINTDEIIPAKYLTENTKEALKPYLLEDLKHEGFSPLSDIPGKNVIITRSNFGCGSSREHAPWALEANGINLVIGVSFARIFKQNMFNCGMMAVELPEEIIGNLFKKFSGKDASIKTDFENRKFKITSNEIIVETRFDVSEFNAELVHAGGWVNYADKRY